MKKTPFLAGLLFATACLFPGAVLHSSSLPPSPMNRIPRESPDYDVRKKARQLYECARRANPNLRWDPCLAEKARRRAQRMVRQGYFEHRDPATGENPAWYLVYECHRSQFAGENLAQGYDPAQAIHRAWMKSSTHRKNLLDSRFSLIGVGCHEYICVELFAGF